jgi:AcrR family transcriptional regulator
MAQVKKKYDEDTNLAEKRRAEITKAAYKIFAEKGYHSTKVEDITSELNMGYGLFYRYFKSKLEVLSRIIDEIEKKITQEIMVELLRFEPKSYEEYLDNIQRLGELVVAILTEDPYLSKILFYEALGINDEINERIHKAFDLFGKYQEIHIEKGIKEGFLRDDILVKETALAINAMIFEGTRRITLAENKEETKRNWVKAVLDLMFQGMKKPTE